MKLIALLMIFTFLPFSLAHAMQDDPNLEPSSEGKHHKGALRKRKPSAEKKGYTPLKETVDPKAKDEPWYKEAEDSLLEWIGTRKNPINLASVVNNLRRSLDSEETFRTYAESHYGIGNKQHLEYLRFLCEIEKGKEQESSGWIFSWKG